MNEEIKEILESSRKIIKSNRENGFDRIIILGDDIDKLLDYITNLQQAIKDTKDTADDMLFELKQENEELREENSKLEIALQNIQEDYDRRIEENERLKENAIHNDKVVDKARWNEIIYKSRCEKASAELKDWEKLDLDNLLVAIRRTQNILQNGSDE